MGLLWCRDARCVRGQLLGARGSCCSPSSVEVAGAGGVPWALISCPCTLRSVCVVLWLFRSPLWERRHWEASGCRRPVPPRPSGSRPPSLLISPWCDCAARAEQPLGPACLLHGLGQPLAACGHGHEQHTTPCCATPTDPRALLRRPQQPAGSASRPALFLGKEPRCCTSPSWHQCPGRRNPTARSQPTAAPDRVAPSPSVRSWLRPAGCCRGLADAGSVWGQLLRLAQLAGHPLSPGRLRQHRGSPW